MILTADEYRERLTAFVGRQVQLYETARLLEVPIGVKITVEDPRRALSHMLSHWLNQILSSVTDIYNGGTTATLSLERLPESLRAPAELEWRYRHSSEDIGDVAHAFLSSYPFPALVEWLSRSAAKLEGEGLESAAKLIASSFGLSSEVRPRKSKQTKRGVVLEKYLYTSWDGYDYALREGVHKLAAAFKIVETHMGVIGASQSMSEAAAALDDTGSMRRLPSRTVVSQSPVRITVFKEKMECLFPRDLADALFAFLVLHMGADHLPGLCSAA